MNSRFETRDLRRALIDLFRVLDTKVENRDPYMPEELVQFPYVNGGLFENEDIEIPNLNDTVKELLLSKASEDFDWSEISPTIIVKTRESSIKLLELKQELEIFSRDCGWQTDYILKDVDGEFNSVWFDEVSSDDKVYMAIAHEVPVIGERYFCYKIEFINGQPNFIDWYTSTVEGINYMGNNICQVTTRNSVYIVNVV